MQGPDPVAGTTGAAAASSGETTDERVDTNREPVGAEDAAADAVRSGADDVTPAGSETELPGTALGAEEEDAYDQDQVTVGRDDARADAARSGADPDEV